VNDPIGDMIARIRNAQMRNKSKVSMPGSRQRERVADLLFGLNAQATTTLVLVTHERTIAARCDRVLEIDGGRLL